MTEIDLGKLIAKLESLPIENWELTKDDDCQKNYQGVLGEFKVFLYKGKYTECYALDIMEGDIHTIKIDDNSKGKIFQFYENIDDKYKQIDQSEQEESIDRLNKFLDRKDL
jgi:hypothetical protein